MTDRTTDPGPPFDADDVYRRVWRVDFSAPGFAWLDAGRGVDSHTLRAGMLGLKVGLSAVHENRTGQRFAARSVGRFDQQVTTKFHLDGAPARSLLMLGYEPSTVTSRLFLADYSRAAHDLGVTPEQFLRDHNPMFRAGEDRLGPYVTELPPLPDGHAGILLINNGSLPFTDAGTNPLGVLHKAVIVTPDPAARRVVNSALLVVGDADEVAPDRLREFVAAEGLSPQVGA